MKTITHFLQMKKDHEPIAMLTAYDAPSAKLAERAGVDMILVGDSLGMVMLGYDSTVPVTMDDMVLHTKAVKRGAKDTFVVTDLPFFAYHSTFSETAANVRRLMQEAGADAVKLEGGKEIVETVRLLVQAGVPVVGHIGLTPQSVGVLGGYKVQGKDQETAEQLVEDAKAIAEAGAFAIVAECIPHQLGTILSKQVTAPIIGIGAGNQTDGQVLVYHDVIGYESPRVPKFVKQYVSISSVIEDGLSQYVREVKGRDFPAPEHQYTMKDDAWLTLYGGTK
ncbi:MULTISPECIES: 3-methyl-2-oxobutanoate hydroxymethyltransferase [Bacillaceae]|uniref:3-methyl-2-oxobutanoate hydroxymethyltransferase n=1 Tax=Alkalicoccobacillus plakortidis TaxID=444060 RepID=A0A9D5HWD8_9BACI|nr:MULTISPECIES: 3-methyl-2-oxobutanoate hydroxymethyltransferase [Bacillaceae]KQL51861.1 3-methyl-2-oxobutanoate hydroxymethyltransferase [Alkalicoccobacillus plakortidis]